MKKVSKGPFEIPTLECLIAVHVRLFFFQNFGRMYGLIRHCMSIYTRITEFITYKKPKIISVCITILSYLYVKYALLQACMFKNSLKQLCLYVYMDCTAIKHSRYTFSLKWFTDTVSALNKICAFYFTKWCFGGHLVEHLIKDLQRIRLIVRWCDYFVVSYFLAWITC